MVSVQQMEGAILTYLHATPGRSAAEIANELSKGGIKVARSVVNPILYKFSKTGACIHTSDQPPRWSIGTAVLGTATAEATAPKEKGPCRLCGCVGACGEAKDAGPRPTEVEAIAKLAIEETATAATAAVTEAASATAAALATAEPVAVKKAQPTKSH